MQQVARFLYTINQLNSTSSFRDKPGHILGIMIGGGSAGIIQAGIALTRATSTATTAGVANPVVTTVEHILAIIGSIFNIVIPFVIAGIVCVVIMVLLFFVIRYFKKHIPKTGTVTSS